MVQRAQTGRKLHVGHFAFMRAAIEGLDLRDSWQRYLQLEGEATDARRVKGAIKWIRLEFAAAAKRHSKPGTARLFRIDAADLGPDQALPTLAEYAVLRGMEDFPESEVAEAYADEFGEKAIKGGASRRGRLIKLQIRALNNLEQLVAEHPKAGDGVGAWLTPSLAFRLEQAGLHTLGALIDRINGVGARWWTSVPGVGERKGNRIVDWIRMHEKSIGLKIGDHVAVRRASLLHSQLDLVVPASTALVPLEKFVVPTELSGHAGLFRAPQTQCLLDATNDYDAIQAWLNSKRAEGPTQRLYRKEAERLLLWAVLQRRKALSSLTVEDATAFTAFLQSPPSAWCGPRHRQRWSPLWRPLEGPLSTNATRQALIVLRGLYAFLIAQNYVVGSPFSGVSLPRVAVRPLGSGRALTFQQWDEVKAQLSKATTPAERRCSRTVRWLYATGLRIAELCDARCGSLESVEFSAADGSRSVGWMLEVIGKGEKYRQVPVPVDLVDELKALLEQAELQPDMRTKPTADIPILANLEERATEAFSTSGAYKAVRIVFEACAARLEASDSASAARIRTASPHWLRHSHASHALNGRSGSAAVPIQVVQNNLGHASIGTTSGYLMTEQDARLSAMQNFWNGK